MSSFVYDGLNTPNGKSDARHLTGLAAQSVTAAEWNAVMSFIEDVRTAILEGNWSGLSSYAADISEAGKARMRVQNGTLEASANAAEYRGIIPAKGYTVDAASLGILPTNTHAQNTAAWDTAMRAGTSPVRWLFGAGTYLFSSRLDVTRPVRIEGVAGTGDTGGTWFRFATGSGGGVRFRGYDNAYGRADGSHLSHVKLDGDGTGAGIECNAPVHLANITVTSFDKGVYVYGNVGTNTEASRQHFERVSCSGNTSYGFHFQGPDANASMVSRCTASDNGTGGFYDQSFLGNYFFACHAESNSVFSYKTYDSNARAFFSACYSEAGQEIQIQHPSAWDHVFTGGSDAAFTGTGFGVFEDEVLGRALRFPFRVGSYSGEITFGGGYVDVTTPWFSKFVTPEASQESFFSTWNNGYGVFTNSKQHDVWGSYAGPPAYEITGANSASAARGFKADYPTFAAQQLYLGANRHRAWDYFEEYGTPLAYALNVFGLKTLVTGDVFHNFYTNAAQGGITAGRQHKYAGYICTRSGTLGTYTDGRTATTNGTLTFTLSGSNSQIAVGQMLTLDGNGPYRVTVVNGTSITCVNTSGGGDLAALASTSGRVIAFYAPELQPFGLIAGQAADSTGSPGAATQQTVSGRVAIAAGASSVTVTNARVTSSSLVFAVLQTVDATLTQILNVVPANGSFTINCNANATLAVNVAWKLEE